MTSHERSFGRPAPFRWPVVVTVAAALAVFGASWLPWASSGQASRSSYELVRSARHLELLGDGSIARLAGAWFAVPLLVAACWTAAVLGRRLAVATLGGLVGLMAVVAALITARSPLTTELGVTVTGVSGVVCLAAAGAVARGARRE